MSSTNDWAAARPRHFVALYAQLHESVYKVPALELRTERVRMSAASLAARALRDHFGGNPSAMAEFVRWVWTREVRDERRRASGQKDGEFRVSWRYQWSARLVTDYRRASVIAGAAP